MTAFLALFRDALRESLDRRAVQFLVVLGLLLALVCGSLSFTLPDVDAVLAQQAREIGTFRRMGLRGGQISTRTPVEPEVGVVRAAVAEDDLPGGIEEARVVELRFERVSELDDLVSMWRAFKVRGPLNERDEAPLQGAPITTGDRSDFLRERLESAGFADVLARTIEGDERAWRVAASCPRPVELSGKWMLGIAFGAFEQEIDVMSPAEFIVALELGIANGFVGFFGMLILLSTFARGVPELVRKGTLDLVLARPLGRARIILYRYAADVLTVLAVATLIFGACSVALGVRSSFFNPNFVACALPATAIFAMLFPVAMLLGIATRNTSLATLGAALCWFLASMIAGGREALRMFGKAPSSWSKALDVAYWIVPKPSDVGKLNELFLARSSLSPAAVARVLELHRVEVDWWYSGGTSALFAGAMLALTVLVFHTRDW